METLLLPRVLAMRQVALCVLAVALAARRQAATLQSLAVYPRVRVAVLCQLHQEMEAALAEAVVQCPCAVVTLQAAALGQ